MSIKAKRIGRSKAFRGQNFMTPNVIGYYSRMMRGRTVHVEVSSGEGMDREPLYGVTFRYPDGMELWREGDDPSRCFRSRADAEAWINAAE